MVCWFENMISRAWKRRQIRRRTLFELGLQLMEEDRMHTSFMMITDAVRDDYLNFTMRVRRYDALCARLHFPCLVELKALNALTECPD